MAANQKATHKYCFSTNQTKKQNLVLNIERFSIECRKVIGFAFTLLRDWLKTLAPLFYPIRSKPKTNRDSLVRVFPRFASATCNYFAFLRHSIENHSMIRQVKCIIPSFRASKYREGGYDRRLWSYQHGFHGETNTPMCYYL